MLFELIDGHELHRACLCLLLPQLPYHTWLSLCSAFAFSAKLLKIAYDDFLAYWAGNKPALPALLAE